MAQSQDDYVAANRAAWDASAPHHRASPRHRALREGFARPGYSCLDDIARKQLAALGIAGKDVAQLCCNNGRELLSVKNLGAARCVGFDQSGAFLAQARELAAAGDIDCDFVETDVYRTPEDYDAAFDLVLVTIGVLGWMPDLSGFVALVVRLLRPGAALLMYEQHPIMNMVEPSEPDPQRLQHSYFKVEPFADEGPILYDGAAGEGDAMQYWFCHTMGDVITALLNQGLVMEQYREFPHNISSAEFDVYNDQPAQLPQSYMLVARKAA